jgi:hypothetical protein
MQAELQIDNYILNWTIGAPWGHHSSYYWIAALSTIGDFTSPHQTAQDPAILKQ